nr:hypothetical protein GCM10017745_45790 [Saccharothrix mutabilis subsp. capreolus]
MREAVLGDMSDDASDLVWRADHHRDGFGVVDGEVLAVAVGCDPAPTDTSDSDHVRPAHHVRGKQAPPTWPSACSRCDTDD